jgi:predicted MPP superfamily phosphohydrolase
MTSYLRDFNPDIIILGGDTVYDNGLRSCYYSWDNFYSMFEPVYDSLGRLVPLVMSIGNHDVGFDALDPVTIENT